MRKQRGVIVLGTVIFLLLLLPPLACLPVRGSSPSADPIVYLSGFLSSDTRPNKTAPLGVGTPDKGVV